VTYASRTYHGWAVTSVTSNRFDQTKIFVDSGKIFRTIPSTTDPSQSQPIFNFTSVDIRIFSMTASRNNHAWIDGINFTSPFPEAYLLYVDLLTSTVKFNISLKTFKPSITSIDSLAVDSKDNVFAIDENNVWSFDTNGKQINYFELAGRNKPSIINIDIDDQNNLWVLEGFDYKSETNRLLQYTPSGELIYSSDVKFPDLPNQNRMINVAVDSAGIAYFTSWNESRILSWSTITNKRGADIPFRARTNYANPLLTLLNDSTLVVAIRNSPDVLVVNVRDSTRSYAVSSPTPQILTPSQLVAVDKSLIVAAAEVLVTMSPDTGSITATLDNNVNRLVINAFKGLTCDQAGNIYTLKLDSTIRFALYVYDSNGKFNRRMPVNTTGPIVINEQTNTIWIINNQQRNNISIDIYDIKYGNYILSIPLPTSVTRVADIRRFSVNGQTGYMIVDDYRSIIRAFYDSGSLFYSFPTKNFYPLSILIDPKTQLTYVSGYNQEGLSQIQIYDTTNQLTEILSPPLGWNTRFMSGLTQDEAGTIYASCAECNAIFAFVRSQSRSGSMLPRRVNLNDFDDQVKLFEEVENVEQIKPEIPRVPVPISSAAKLSPRHSRSHRINSTLRRSSVRPMN